MLCQRIDLRLPDVSSELTANTVAEGLRVGSVVVLPTETVYGLAVRAADELAVQHLIQIKRRHPEKAFALALPNHYALSEYVPECCGLAMRLARRCLPGPVSLVLDVSSRDSTFHLLPKFVRSVASLDSAVSFRIPSHPFTLKVLQELDEAVVLTSANRSGQSAPLSPAEIAEELGDEIDLLVEDGTLPEAVPSTVVKVTGNQYTIVREGAIKKETIARLTSRVILFVCTGNTCRSPMAERICEKILAQRLGCFPDELEKKGFAVLSAGLEADDSVPASPQAIEVLRQEGMDLRDHRSQTLNKTHIQFADRIFTMTRHHRERVLSLSPDSDTRLNVLRIDGGDIADPFGSSEQVYHDCAKQIEAEIRKRLDQIL